MEKNSYNKVVVFGASGFLGVSLVERLIQMGYDNILSVSRGEAAAVALKEKFPIVEIMIGDIADEWTVKKAMVGARMVIICSAMKHVGLAEKEVKSCVSTNIVGTMNIIEESLTTKPQVVVFISSDKSSRPTGVYGCSKKIGEKLMEEAERINPETKYRSVKYGNILYSSGSVLCKWKERMQKGEEVIVTEPEATRFFWDIQSAIDLIFDCITRAKDAKPYITPMKSMRIGDLLEAMMEKYGRVPVKTIGLQIGENMHELIAEHLPNSAESDRFTKEEIMALI